MATPIQLQTERLILRDWRDEDRAPFARIGADPEVMRFYPSTLTREQSDQFIDGMHAHIAAHGWGFWAVELRATGELIGFTGVRSASGLPIPPGLEAGWRVGREHWRRGYASEAASACFSFAFGQLGVERVLAVTALPNLASQAVMRKIGMRQMPEWEFVHPRVPAAHPLQRHCVYAAERSAWAAGAR
jgi:RimJ/RimL family protein N-acetyltransferase